MSRSDDTGPSTGPASVPAGTGGGTGGDERAAETWLERLKGFVGLRSGATLREDLEEHLGGARADHADG